ncbi:MAG: hypothetical protein EZS28_008310 [Streblomastix strix]|uniref:Uncharacterized protein n=1 Tax=Streblomastix strix TaxID=222440 RepID=A0A5J4WN04_9EUKA|nr:MAG: hypothetical protein EZS28_008310 [Streblomastix strix]
MLSDSVCYTLSKFTLLDSVSDVSHLSQFLQYFLFSLFFLGGGMVDSTNSALEAGFPKHIVLASYIVFRTSLETTSLSPTLPAAIAFARPNEFQIFRSV